MTATDIPEDLVEEILSRVPAASMKRLRSTCKRWNTLFRDGRFSKKHSGKAPKQSLILMCKDYRICPMRVNLNVAPPLIDLKDALSLKDSPSNNSKQVDIELVSHCDGLLLCTTKDDRLVVWNPCLGETRWIKHKDGCEVSDSMFALGYENTKSDRSYKILRYWRYDETNHEPVVGFETYEFSSNTWRVLEGVTLERLELPVDGVSLKGNTYWVQSYMTNDVLYCFDFTKERFKRNRFLPQFQNCNGGRRVLSVVGEEKLSVLNWNLHSPKMDIWVTDKIDTDTEAALTWSKVFTVVDHVYLPMSFVLDEEKNVAVCCNASNETNNFMICTIGEDRECYTELIPYTEGSTDISLWPFLLSYVPSLVQIKQ